VQHPAHRRSLGWLAVTGLAATALTLTAVPTAAADGHHAYPSRQQVQTAKAAVAQRSQDVGVIRAQLALASQQLNALDVSAEQATEAYNGARWHLQQARQAARSALAKSARAQQRLSGQRAQVGALIAGDYQSGTTASQLGLLLNANGPGRLLNQYSAFEGAAQTMQAAYERYSAESSLAKVFASQARSALARQRLAAVRAKQLQRAAQSAVNQQAVAVAAINSRQRQLIQRLAAAQNVSVQLVQERQQALQRIREQQQAAAARAAAEAAARRQARQQARALAEQQAQEQAQQRARAAARARQQRQSSPPAAQQSSNPSPAPVPPPAPPAPAPAPPPPPPAPPGPASGAAAAVAFAYAQLGEPYVWGAVGPDSWDCSGLTMGAWAAAGVSLPHYTVAQYYATTPVSYSQLQPGDLVFWASNPSDPNTIFHVALYIGNDEIIQAPHTGLDVEVSSMWAWLPPTSYGRV
jgi:cell wall-associated NlpC family hydrolase